LRTARAPAGGPARANGGQDAGGAGAAGGDQEDAQPAGEGRPPPHRAPAEGEAQLYAGGAHRDAAPVFRIALLVGLGATTSASASCGWGTQYLRRVRRVHGFGEPRQQPQAADRERRDGQGAAVRLHHAARREPDPGRARPGQEEGHPRATPPLMLTVHCCAASQSPTPFVVRTQQLEPPPGAPESTHALITG